MKSFPLLARAGLALIVLLAAAALLPAGPVQGADFADSAFLRTWTRTDAPVAAGHATRSWYWGPQPICSTHEPYKEAADGSGARLVQYFDKSRMELNNPSGDQNSPWFVTNGLLAYEMIAGLVQTGNSTYETRSPADINLASDLDDPNAPTYHTFQSVTSTPAGRHLSPSAIGRDATLTIARDGTLGNDPAKAFYPGTVITYYDPTSQHNVPKIFWDYINQVGPIYENGRLTTGKLSVTPSFVAGLPLSEAYWARVKVGGTLTDVLIQVFQRRVLTYIPAYSAPWNVQMGNIGAHYRMWRYGNVNCSSPPPPPPAPTATPVPTPSPRAVPLYELYNSKSHEHFYTIDPAERSRIITKSGFTDQGNIGNVWDRQAPNTTPFYRLYNGEKAPAERHLLTLSDNERDVALSNGWTLETSPNGGAGGGYVYARRTEGTVPLYRFYSAQFDDHLFLLNVPRILPSGYHLEYLACYLLP